MCLFPPWMSPVAEVGVVPRSLQLLPFNQGKALNPFTYPRRAGGGGGGTIEDPHDVKQC